MMQQNQNSAPPAQDAPDMAAMMAELQVLREQVAKKENIEQESVPGEESGE